ncbi:hypothetical protein IHN63_10870 [Deinococcus sp. 6YEL10]|uniref:hypothetical protein n=1 Tax=Deinococcus sp. 6YEL10 TaxID=2745870 RepID=UPI001E2DD0B3|nr:hypothetical protein [Deinococcus sp. 6YEL10]MCD0161807.1 hypothetical protein [Deinococcus sp. 6YEL10]
MRYLERLIPMLLSIITVAQAQTKQAACEVVYSDSVRNISSETKRSVEANSLFDQHCSASGEVKSSGMGIDFSAVVKNIPVKLGINTSNSSEAMQQFCKIYQTSDYAQLDVSSFNSSVVTDALKLYNQCKVLEGNNVKASHVTAGTRAVTFSFDFDKNKVNVVFDHIQFDTSLAKCTSTAFNPLGFPSVISPKTRRSTISRPFSVTCVRIPQKTPNGNRYPPVSIEISTNFGPYVVNLPGDQEYSYQVASKALAQINLLKSQVTKLNTDKIQDVALKDALSKRINDANVTAHTVVVGQYGKGGWQHFGCDTKIADIWKLLCPNSKIFGSQNSVNSHSGDQCGYSYYLFACLNI